MTEREPLKKLQNPVMFRVTPTKPSHLNAQALRDAENHLEPIFGLQTQTAQSHSMPLLDTAWRRAGVAVGSTAAHALQAGFRAEVGQTSESTGSAGFLG